MPYPSSSEDFEKYIQKKLDELCENYYEHFHLYALTVCRDLHQAEELVQQIIFRFLDNLLLLRPLVGKENKNWINYIKVCLKNEFYNSFRKKGISTVSIDEMESADANIVSKDDSRMPIEQRFDILCEWVESNATLNPNEKKLWNMMKEGKKPQEIAQKLGAKSHTTRQQIYRLRQKIRAQIPDGMKDIIS